MLPSLQEINRTIPARRAVAFLGPGALVAVGYMDPGNWVTSIQGGAETGYALLSVILLSSLSAMFLQYLCVKLGMGARIDLAQATRMLVGSRVAVALWIIAELAIMATDIAEVIGAAIALNLLFHWPLVLGVLVTVADVLVLLVLTHMGFRKVEAIVIALIATVTVIFFYQTYLVSPEPAAVLAGFEPRLFQGHALVLALGIVGATVMPHNLYLHSSIVQSRAPKGISTHEAIRFGAWDSHIQLTIAFVVNCMLLILGAGLFHGMEIESFQAIYDHLLRVSGPLVATLFAVALLASGQNSTITGTLSGQIVMEGFVHIHIAPWARRMITRCIAVIPVLMAAIFWGPKELDDLLINSQVFLSIALPFSIIPLVWITSSERFMGEYKNKPVTTIVGWIIALVLTGLDLYLLLGA
ncbi:MAG: Nramp family divalent metal transporter [Corynebacterium sp.]|nr:Nramp family divalent metal transporter [Corynebacterium sp.]